MLVFLSFFLFAKDSGYRVRQYAKLDLPPFLRIRRKKKEAKKPIEKEETERRSADG